MEFRTAEPEDTPGLRRVLIEAFGRPDEADLVDRLRADGDIADSFVALIDRVVVAGVVFSRLVEPDWALALAPVGVLPALQRRAIGTQLIKIALAHLQTGPRPGVFVLGEPTYYGRFGFDVAAAAGFASPYAGPHFALKALASPLPAASGIARHAPAFAALE